MLILRLKSLSTALHVCVMQLPLIAKLAHSSGSF